MRKPSGGSHWFHVVLESSTGSNWCQSTGQPRLSWMAGWLASAIQSGLSGDPLGASYTSTFLAFVTKLSACGTAVWVPWCQDNSRTTQRKRKECMLEVRDAVCLFLLLSAQPLLVPFLILMGWLLDLLSCHGTHVPASKRKLFVALLR